MLQESITDLDVQKDAEGIWGVHMSIYCHEFWRFIVSREHNNLWVEDASKNSGSVWRMFVFVKPQMTALLQTLVLNSIRH